MGLVNPRLPTAEGGMTPRHAGRPDAAAKTFAARRAGPGIRIVPLVAIMGLSLALAACDRCGDFFWQKQPGTCRNGPTPN